MWKPLINASMIQHAFIDCLVCAKVLMMQQKTGVQNAYTFEFTEILQIVANLDITNSEGKKGKNRSPCSTIHEKCCRNKTEVTGLHVRNSNKCFVCGFK